MSNFKRRVVALPVTTPWATKREIRKACRAAYKHRANVAPLETLEAWLTAHPEAPNPNTHEFQRRSGQLANAWLNYARQRNAGELPPSLKRHSNTVERIGMFCAYCEGPMPLLPHEVRQGRKYCSQECAADGYRAFGNDPYSDTNKRNRQIMRMTEDGLSSAEVADYFGLKSASVRTIRSRCA